MERMCFLEYCSNYHLCLYGYYYYDNFCFDLSSNLDLVGHQYLVIHHWETFYRSWFIVFDPTGNEINR